MKQTIKIILPVICIFILSSCLRSSKKEHIKFTMIDYRYGFNNELNTFNDSFTKGMAGSGSIKIQMQLSEPEQDEIIHKALAINFFHMQDTLRFNKQNFREAGMSANNGQSIQFLRIKYKNMDKKIVWLGAIPYNNSNYKGLIELTALIRSAIETKQEYKALPGNSSGYIQYYFSILKFLLRG